MNRLPLCAMALIVSLGTIPAEAQTGEAPAHFAPDQAPFGTTAPVQSEQLGTIAGQADVQQVVSSQNKAEVSRNSVSGNSVTGTIGLGNAFQAMNGLSVVNANTGNNVAINASMNVNIAIHP